MKYELFTRVSLRTAIAKHKLKAGEAATVSGTLSRSYRARSQATRWRF